MTAWRPWLPVGFSVAVLIAALLLAARTSQMPVALSSLPAAVHVDRPVMPQLRIEVAHPVFAPSRSNMPVGSDLTANTLAPAPALTGIASGGGKALALVKNQKGDTEILYIGEAVDGWTLTAIGDHEATFARAGESHVGKLQFGGVPDAKASNPTGP